MPTTLHPTFGSPNEKSNRENIEKNAEKLFQWFYNNLFETNPEKSHFLTNNSEKMLISIRSEKISSSSSQKLLKIHITANISFDDHLKILCRKASQ